LAETRRQIENAATGSSGSMKNISQQSIMQLLIPSASPECIKRVVDLDVLYENQISAMRREVDRLRLLEQGLMDDLLTGHIHVTSASL
jgi:type I restriction enzyme, S subunit